MILSKTGYNTWYNLVYLNEEIYFDHFWGAKEHHYTYIPALHAWLNLLLILITI